MLKLAVLTVLVAFGCAWEVYEDLLEEYSGSQDGGLWEAGYNEYFAGMTKDQIKRMMGTKLDKANDPTVPIKSVEIDEATVPGSFDARKKWPKCSATISHIKDQAACGSCWAVAASTQVEDRTCIANYANIQTGELVEMSGEQINSCCDWCGDGCHGGYPIDAMRYWCWTGIVTGGPYGSHCGCYPYGVPPCGPNGCGGEKPTPRCMRNCRSGYGMSFSQDKHYCKDHYQIASAVSQLQAEIMAHGTIECAFTVYSNFMTYRSGVYSYHTGEVLGGHAVSCIGWGVYNGVPYWIFKNSWNTTWGMQGYFWFKRGIDLCGMESQCVAGIPKGGDQNLRLKC